MSNPIRTLKDTTQEKKVSSLSSYHEMLERESLRLHPGKDGMEKAFCEELWNFFRDNPAALRLNDFCIGSRYTYRKVKHYVNYYPEIKDCWEEIKLTLGNRRYRGFVGANDDFKNGNNLWKDIHKFDEEFHEINKYHQDLKQEEAAKNIEQVVKITKRLIDREKEAIQENV